MDEIDAGPPSWRHRDFLVQATVVGGVGSSDVGLDRGDALAPLLARADRLPAVTVVAAANAAFGHSGSSAHERAAARSSFAESVLATCPNVSADSFDPTPLAFTDLFRAGRMISSATGERFALDHDRCWLTRARWYGEVLALESVLTFGVTRPRVWPASSDTHGPRGVRPEVLAFPAPADAMSIRQQVALRPLPAEGYAAMRFDPTIGATVGSLQHQFDRIDTSDARCALATRFRLAPPDARPEPIVFYLDPAIPPALRADVHEGGQWWSEAFAAAGHPQAFRLADLPDGVDITDPRINIVLWVHRADRGWSYGLPQADPRSGEILRSVVRLGSQRVEQIRALGEALLAPYSTGRTADLERIVHQRMRQLAAHEIGHGLGLAHNFASQWHPSPSAMDYPGPLLTVGPAGELTCDEVYSGGPGPWDFRQIRALYGTGPTAAAEPVTDDLLYIADADARLDDCANADGAVWTAPREPFAALASALEVRAAALAGFSPGVVPAGSDGGDIEARFVLAYLYHRHAAAAVAKLIGGTRRRYALTDGHAFAGQEHPVPAEAQRRALAALRELMTPAFLAIPAHIRPLLAGPGGGAARRPDVFGQHTGGSFDEFAAVRSAADLIALLIAAPRRLNRVYLQSANGDGLAVADVVSATIGYAAGLIQDSGGGIEAAIGWGLFRRFGETLCSPDLHDHVRFDLVERAEPVFASARPMVAGAWERAKQDALGAVAHPDQAPVGVPL